MTHPFGITNGASLEDCHTNFFALTDLNGIKWRRLHADAIFDPSDDPVLKSYSKCLSAGILTVWRRVWLQKSASYNQSQNENSLSCYKELWLFWHGQEPDFSTVVEPCLFEAEQGSWESGISYECRSLYFKALHNSIESCLFSRGYARLGKFFVQPQTIFTKKKKQFASSLHFFVHGESTVCACIDTRTSSLVYTIDKCHISASQNNDKDVKVILAPYGYEGKLTGNGYKYTDPHIAKLLNDWLCYYSFPANYNLNTDVPNMLEVSIGGAIMKYPTPYIFITEEDHRELFRNFPPVSTPSLPPIPKSSNSGLLTPPLSPVHTNSTSEVAKNAQEKPAQNSQAEKRVENSYVIQQSISQEGYISANPEKTDDNAVLWDFRDPMAVASCGCSHKKRSKMKHSSSGQEFSRSYFSNSFSRAAKINRIPFHKREHGSNDSVPQYSEKSPFAKSLNTDSKGLPQLLLPSSSQKYGSFSEMQPKFSTTGSSDHDPAMPTLSPQPPLATDGVVLLSDDPEPQIEMGYEVGEVSERSTSDGVLPKGRLSDENLPPVVTSLLHMFENSSKKSPLTISADPGQIESIIYLTETNEINFITDLKAPERPQLAKRSLEDHFKTDQMNEFHLLYSDLQSANSLNSRQPPKKMCVASPNPNIPNVVKDEYVLPMDCDTLGNVQEFFLEQVPLTPKDPYEFTEFDESSPSDKGFRQKMEFLNKDDKFFQPIPSPITPLSIPSVPMSLQDHTLEEMDKIMSPVPPKIFRPKFIREEDLAVSLNDLDNIFDTSSSDEEENSDVPPTNAKVPQCDEFIGKMELLRMYPTPPSLDQNAVPSPFGISFGIDSVVAENEALKVEEDQLCVLKLEPEIIDVFSPVKIEEFPECDKYTALSDGQFVHESKLSDNLVYKSTWSRSNSSLLLRTIQGQNSFYNQHILGQPTFADDTNQFFQQETSYNYYPYSNCEAISPPTGIGSFLDTGALSNSPLEINSLHLNLLLSDSMLNIFKDKNFDSCCLCVCNMNIKGSDAGIILPSSLIPTWNDEPQYKCTCAYSAAIYRSRGHLSGLFYEDELEVMGRDVAESTLTASSSTLGDNVNPLVMDIMRIQCKGLGSRYSLFGKFQLDDEIEESGNVDEVAMKDGCEICFMALEEAKVLNDNAMLGRLDENAKSSCLHKWCYASSPVLNPSHDVRLHLDALKPLLQRAVHKKNNQMFWDVTYVVSGPLTWRDFHKLAGKGTIDQLEPQPIPSLLMGHEKEDVVLSPFGLKLWDKLQLAPHSLPRDIAYIVVAPENDIILNQIKVFFRELSMTYETLRLGKHRPVTKVLRNGIMRVGKTAASKVADEPVGRWFSSIGEGSVSSKLKLYARVCKHRLAPHLSTLNLDKTIFDVPTSTRTSSEHNGSSSMGHSSELTERSPKFSESNLSSDHLSYASTNQHEVPDEDSHSSPALVIYIVEPFTFSQKDPETYRLVSLGLLHSYADMIQNLPETIKNSIHLQLLSLDSIVHNGGRSFLQKNELKTLALSVYSQSCQHFHFQPTVKSMTGFGPTAAQDKFLSNRNGKMSFLSKVHNQPYILASLKDKQTELGEMFGDQKEKSATLFCSYCLTKDRKYILACCTNDKGEFTETNIINIHIPNRHRHKQLSVRRYGLKKLFDYLMELISNSVKPWRIVIDRFGRLGHGELKAWASLLSRRSLHSYTKRLRDMCSQCSISGPNDAPNILSIALVSIGPDDVLRIMPDQFTPGDRFSSNRCRNCRLKTPEDATCTHILVFPTSATLQSSQVTFQQEHIDPLPGGLGEDLFDALDEEDIPGADMNDIFRWPESPHSGGNSPLHDNSSLPSSPNAAFHFGSGGQGGSSRSENLLYESSDETLQLLQQPLALGYYVSTAKTGSLPKWFWSSCPQLENKVPVFLKSALLIHVPFLQQTTDELLHSTPQQQATCHPLDSNFTADVLRYVLEGYNALSWLSLDSDYRDRRSCLPIHMQVLMQLYRMVEAIL